MYDKKTLLYLALAMIGFMLWNAWQTDHPKKTAVAITTQSATSTSAAAPSATPAPNDLRAEAAPQSRVVTVKTDTWNAQIDTLGGDLISLQLPKYPVSHETPNVPVTLLTHSLPEYYVTQAGVTSKDGFDSSNIQFTTQQNAYASAGDQATTVVLTGQKDGLDIKKIYTFEPKKYVVTLSYQITNNNEATWTGNLFSQIKRRGGSDDGGVLGLHTYRGAAISSADKPYEKVSYKDMDKANLDRSIKGGWLAMQQRYFVTAWVPNPQDAFHYYSRVDSLGLTDKAEDKIYTIGVQSPEITLSKGQTYTSPLKLYSGPEIASDLKNVAPNLDRVVDYGWLSFLAVPIFKVMQWIYSYVGNWGVAIILVTVLIKLLFYKLSETSYRSMARMRHLQPKLLALKDRYGDDRQKLSQATMELYRKEKVNPLGGCLPMVIQIPVFIALYYVLIESVALRQAPFMLWIQDLSVKDPYYILPVIMGLSWMLQQRLNPPPPDPVQAKMMMLFPVVFTVLFAGFPAGLVLYWIVNNCLSILQQWYVMRKVDAQAGSKSSAKGQIKRSN